MIDPIERAGQEISIVVYDNPLPPKYFRLKKKFLKKLFIVFPIFLVSTFTILFIWGLVVRSGSVSKEPVTQKTTIDEDLVSQLRGEILSLKESNSKLTEKLSSQISSTTPEDPFLMTIKKPYGMQNLISSQLVGVDQFNLSQESDKINFKFQIISTTPETKITGHVIVYMVSNTGILTYPYQEVFPMKDGLKFSAGEPFSVSRLRPTTASFQQKGITSRVTFKIYIFNREGDLLLVKETDPYTLGVNK
jgi:hypothetical protein